MVQDPPTEWEPYLDLIIRLWKKCYPEHVMERIYSSQPRKETREENGHNQKKDNGKGKGKDQAKTNPPPKSQPKFEEK